MQEMSLHEIWFSNRHHTQASLPGVRRARGGAMPNPDPRELSVANVGSNLRPRAAGRDLRASLAGQGKLQKEHLQAMMRPRPDDARVYECPQYD